MLEESERRRRVDVSNSTAFLSELRKKLTAVERTQRRLSALVTRKDGDEEVLDTITTDTVYRLFLLEKYWPAIRKLGVQDTAAITRSNSGMVTVLRIGLQDGNIGQWIEKAMSMEQQWDDPWPLLPQRLDNVGHVHASIDTHMVESAAEDYLAAISQDLKAALEDIPPPRKFTREYKGEDGSVEVCHYDLDYFANGPFKVEITSPVIKETWEETNARQPKTKRKYFNPANNKWIGYGRAKQLGVI